MEKGTGFDTPAKRLEALSEQLKDLDKIKVTAEDAIGLALLALGLAFIHLAATEPKRARKLKDTLLQVVEKMGFTSDLRQAITKVLTTICESVE